VAALTAVILLLAVLSAAILPRDAAHDPGAAPGASQRPRAVVMGFYTDPEPGLPGSLGTARARSEQLTFVCPFWYRIGFAADGAIIPYADWFDAEHARAVTRELQEAGVRVLALIHNMRLGAGHDMRAIFHTILSDPARRTTLVGNIVALLEQEGYDGVNLDTEHLYPADRHLFTAFVAELAAELRPRGLLVTADLPAQLGDDPMHGWSGGFDLAALAPHLDYIAIMAYDEHGWVTTAGPVASIGFVRAALEYAVSVAPPEKVLLGLAGHVFDWREGERFPAYTSYARAMATAEGNGAALRWDEEAKSPYFDYLEPSSGTRRQVWYEDARSYAYKLDLVHELELGGVALWRLGLEDEALWELLHGLMLGEAMVAN